MTEPRDDALRPGFSFPQFEFGFTARLDQAGADALCALVADAPVDPGLEERIAHQTCPSCGLLLSQVQVGHAWSLDLSTREYGCSDPPYPGGPDRCAASSGGEPEIRPSATAAPREGRR